MNTDTGRVAPMTVGQLSRRTGVSIKNLREYTDLGLICAAGRSPANYRLFGAEALDCVDCILRLRGLGLTIAEIRQLTRTTCPSTSDRFEAQLAERLRASRRRLHARIAALELTLARIDAFETEHRAQVTGLTLTPG